MKASSEAYYQYIRSIELRAVKIGKMGLERTDKLVDRRRAVQLSST